MKVRKKQSRIRPSHTPALAKRNYVNVINLHPWQSLEAKWVLNNRRHESQFFWPRQIPFYLGQINCDSWLIFLSTHLTSKLHHRWRLMTSTQLGVACAGVWLGVSRMWELVGASECVCALKWGNCTAAWLPGCYRPYRLQWQCRETEKVSL